MTIFARAVRLIKDKFWLIYYAITSFSFMLLIGGLPTWQQLPPSPMDTLRYGALRYAYA